MPLIAHPAWLLLLALVVVVICFAQRHRGKGLLTVIHNADWKPRLSIVRTPPRPFSPDKKRTEDESIIGSAGYRDAFPPSSRENLLRVLPGVALAPNPVEIRKDLAPFTLDYRECGPSLYTPTGVSLGEIKTLGDFPNYAELSGVPLPDEYKGFRIETALPRPYRPFRWAYHQTMCMCPSDGESPRLTHAKL